MGQAAGNEKIARVAAAHFDNVGLGPEARDVGSKDNFGMGHRSKAVETKG